MPRCPKGTHRNKQTGLCEPKQTKTQTKVCPPGKLLNPKTNRCIQDTEKNRKKIKMKPKTQKKVKKLCPPGQILNPKTNRCIKDTEVNRKKLNLPRESNLTKLTSIPFRYCKTNKITMPLDLQLVSVSKSPCTISNKVKHITEEMKRTSLLYQSKRLCPVQFLNNGTYGNVYRYSDEENHYQLALKSYNDKHDDEFKILRFLKKINLPCGVVNIKLIYLSSRPFSIMDLMNGDCKFLQGNPKYMNPQNIIFLIREIANHLYCLHKHELSYTDLKLANVLFKCMGDKVMKVCLGDVGGICKQGKQNASTYTPWEYRMFRGFPICNEKTMVWTLGVFVLDLLGLNVSFLEWNHIYKIEKNQCEYFIQKFVRYPIVKQVLPNGKLSRLVFNMLRLNPLKRISLEDLLKELN